MITENEGDRIGKQSLKKNRKYRNGHVGTVWISTEIFHDQLVL